MAILNEKVIAKAVLAAKSLVSERRTKAEVGRQEVVLVGGHSLAVLQIHAIDICDAQNTRLLHVPNPIWGFCAQQRVAKKPQLQRPSGSECAHFYIISGSW